MAQQVSARPEEVLEQDTLNVTVEQPTGVIASDTLNVTVQESVGVIASDTLQVTVEEQIGVIASDTLNVTVSEPTESEATITQFNTFSGPFPPLTTQTIAEAVMQNTGDASGDMHIVFAELDADGNLLQELCRQRINGVAPDAYYTLERTGEGQCITNVSGQEQTAPLRITTPTQFGVEEFYGLKTWSNDESEPDFPSGELMSVQSERG